MTSNSNVSTVQSPHSHPDTMQQQQQTPLGSSGQSPLARYMMIQSPQNVPYRSQVSPMNVMSKKESKLCIYIRTYIYIYEH